MTKSVVQVKSHTKKCSENMAFIVTEKVIGVICDNQFFVKKTEAGIHIYPNSEEASPYTGAKTHLVIDSVDDRELMAQFISATYHELPAPKPKKNFGVSHSLLPL